VDFKSSIAFMASDAIENWTNPIPLLSLFSLVTMKQFLIGPTAEKKDSNSSLEASNGILPGSLLLI
jgi:hypothetical protein